MLSRNTKALLLVLLVAMAAMMLVGCEDSVSVSTSSGTVEFSGHVTKSQVKNAIKALEDSQFGVTASSVGAEIKAKYGECNASVDLYKAVGDRCVKMGLSRNCTTK